MTELRTLAGRLLRQPLLWALIYGALAAYGIYAFWKIPVEVLPRFNFPEISILTHQPGATATELETDIARPLEAELFALPNLVTVRSNIGNGAVETDVRFSRGTDAQIDLGAVNSAIDRARQELPLSVNPYAEIMGNGVNEVADYAVEVPAGIAPAAVQRAVMANIVPALRALPGVQRVEVYGSGEEALWVQPHLASMVRFQVPVTAIVQAVRESVLLDPGGYVTQGHQDVLIEARNLPLTAEELEQVPVNGAGGPVPLGDVATVVRSSVPTRSIALLDHRPAIAMIVFKQPNASTIPVTGAVSRTLRELRGQMPPGTQWISIYDQGHLVRMVGTDLTRNLVIGGLLAIAVMFWMLGAGRGIWVLALSIPLSLLLGISALYATGHSLNLMTLGALTIAVGLLADDGIIVLESIYHRWERGDQRWPGVLQGLRDIASPDVSGTLTTVSVFAPMLFVSGLAGLFFVPFSLAMTLALLASLVISLSLVPLCLGFLGARPQMKSTSAGRALHALRQWNDRLFEAVARHPWISLSACVALLAASLAGLVLVPVNFLPLPNEGVLLESFSLPPGSSMLDTEDAVMAITRGLRRDPAVAHVFARIGSAEQVAYTEPSYAGEIQITLKPSVRMNSLDAIGNRILRESRLPGVQLSLDTPTVERTGESLSGLPQPFVLDVYGGDIDTLRSVAGQITSRLRRVPQLGGIFDNDGYPVTDLQLQPRAGALAQFRMTPFQLYQQIDPLMNGEVVAQVPEGNVPLDLYVRLADAPRKSAATLAELPIRTAGWTPLGDLARLDMATTPNEIRHIDGARALEILATPRAPLGSTIGAAKRALAGLRLPSGYRIAFGGLYPQLEHAALALGIASVAAFLLMVVIMVLQFDGLLVPGLLLLQIPLAFTGGAIGLLVSGAGLNAVGLVAFLTLVGIGLNHGIVLLYRTRRNEAMNMPVDEAVREALHVRFRPIVLTTLTAALGMLPTALGWGEGAAPEQGLAVVVMGGILWSALLSTNLLPALYLHFRRRQITRQEQI